jgi:hypothetical protein
MEVLDHATRASRTIGEGLERMARHYRLLEITFEMGRSPTPSPRPISVGAWP